MFHIYYEKKLNLNCKFYGNDVQNLKSFTLEKKVLLLIISTNYIFFECLIYF